MSIPATLWSLKFPRHGEVRSDGGWITLSAQVVPADSGTPTLSEPSQCGDSYAALPAPSARRDAQEGSGPGEVIIFVIEDMIAETNQANEAGPPLLAMAREEYDRISFPELHRRLCERLRGEPPEVVADISLPDRTKPIDQRGQIRPKILAGDLDLSQPVELVVLSVKEKSALCRLPGSDRVITLRSSRLWILFPGEIASVKPAKQWSYARHPYLSGEILSARLDVPALGLVPLRLEDRGLWDPREHYWGEEGEPIEEWGKPIFVRGPRPEFEMEQILPGSDPANFDSDPILESIERKDAGEPIAARRMLMELCQADLRCLDAHAHLGHFAFDSCPKDALRHFEVGIRIGELSLGPGFDGLLPWGYIHNRPFLRNMHGFGLCLWRLGRFEEAHRLFSRMLWLNPSDNQGVRFLLEGVRAQTPWTDDRVRVTTHQERPGSGIEVAASLT